MSSWKPKFGFCSYPEQALEGLNCTEKATNEMDIINDDVLHTGIIG